MLQNKRKSVDDFVKIWYFKYIQKKKKEKRRVLNMLNDEICKLREKLNDSILNEKDYNITYQISVELDQLIAQYYSTQIKVVKEQKEGKQTKKIVKPYKRKELIEN